MERFAFKIDAALRANLYKICRLCGIDNPSKVPILPKRSDIIDLDEPSLSQKVFELVGFTVTKDDKMPQTMCTLCVDKINDFYEFREMCYATNKQTRNLLGLKQADPQKLMDIKPIFKSESLVTIAKRGRKRKSDDLAAPTASGSSGKSNTTEVPLDSVKDEPIPWRKKIRLQQQQQQQQLLPASKTEIKEEPLDADANKTLSAAARKRRTASCSVCGERFITKEMAEEHKSYAHVPTILKYACHACNQIHNSASDIKAHQLWHKLSKTPYQCPLCGASVANNYAFNRHLKEHTVPTPIGLLVLDRECPICRKTFLTNFFYNTHPCARRTKKCGGCNRNLSTETSYMRHAPHCSKIYLNHSKHIMPEAADTEAQMRIKNEYGVDIEDNAMSSMSTYPQDRDMQPVVVLERLSSPLLRASEAPNSLGRNNDRVSTKSYLKRVDQLLKNTMSTLVSIKHEPEMHIDDTGPLPTSEQPESEPEEEPAGHDDFHFNAGNEDSDEDAPTAAPAEADVTAVAVAVKQEILDEAYEREQVKQEPLKLKLKITKNHGQLNSSIVDDDHDLQTQSKSAKKKKKRKHKERNKELEASNKTTTTEDSSKDLATNEDSTVATVTIKQERLDDTYSDANSAAQADPQFEPQATVMTSIPMLQLDNSYSDVTQETPVDKHQEPEDVKPNRLELDRLLQITHIASGVVMAEEAMPPESAVEAVPNEMPTEIPVKPAKKPSTKSTARKSTAKSSNSHLENHLAEASTSANSVLDSVPQEEEAASSSSETATSSTSPFNEIQLPHIVSVESGASVPFNIVAIKPEPLNRGYADESELEEQETMRSDEINHNEKIDEEAAYINSLDLSNVTIKQEKDLHISDVSEPDHIHFNGLPASEDEDEADDSASSADEADENMDTYEEQEERIYREIELTPLEEQTPAENPTLTSQNESEHKQMESEIDQVESENMQEESESGQVELENVGLESQATAEELNTDAVQNETDMITPSDPSLELQAETAEPQLLEEIPTIEPEQATTSTSAFNFVITSVCSQAEEALPFNNVGEFESAPETLEKCNSGNSEENVTCPEINLTAPKDNETLAQPFFDSNSTNYNCDEEQQNVLNHEISATDQEIALPAVEEQDQEQEQELEVPEAGSSAAACANEETENRINELQQQQQQEQQQQQPQQQQQQQQRCEIDDDSNINEIAENNNNANIERELNDDANVAQENPNI